MIKKKNQVIRYSEFHVNMCHNLQSVHNSYVQSEGCNTCLVMYRLKIVTHV